MKKDGLLAEILNAVINYNKKKVKTSKPDYFLNQKKQLWFRMMNIVDDDDLPGSRDQSAPRD